MRTRKSKTISGFMDSKMKEINNKCTVVLEEHHVRHWGQEGPTVNAEILVHRHFLFGPNFRILTDLLTLLALLNKISHCVKPHSF